MSTRRPVLRTVGNWFSQGHAENIRNQCLSLVVLATLGAYHLSAVNGVRIAKRIFSRKSSRKSTGPCSGIGVSLEWEPWYSPLWC